MLLYNVHSKTAVLFLLVLIMFASCTLEDGIEEMRPIPEGNGLQGNTCIVSFEADGGIPEPTPQTLEKGSTVEEPEMIIKEGYLFLGWYKNTDFSSKWNFTNDTVSSNITLYALWQEIPANSRLITFNANGGTPVPPQQIVVLGEKISKPSTIVKTGYILAGWYRNAGLTNEWDFDEDTVSASVILYAAWNPITYTVIYDANGGEGDMPNSDFTYSINQNLRANTFIRTGYTFTGWALSISGQVIYENTQEVQNLTATDGADVTLFAVWWANNYTVAYNSNGGTGTMESSAFIYGVLQNLRLNTFTRTGYSFKGWSLTETGQVEFADGSSVSNISVNEETVTLYAQWEGNNFTVAYNSNGGTGTMENSAFTYGVPQNLRSNTFTRTGYGFTGWSYTQSGAVEFTDGASVSNLSAVNGSTVTLYARWSGNSYTVAYNANGGNGMMAESGFTYGIAQNLRANTFTRADHIFSGWATTEDGAAVYTDQQSVMSLTETAGVTVTLYAVWQSTIVPGENLAAKLEWLQSNALSNVGYTVEVSTNEIIAPHGFSFTGKNGISITLKGMDSMRVIAFSANGTLFTVSSGVTLVLENNITIQGRNNNTDSVVRVNSGGILVMNSGSIITSNTNTSSIIQGGGIYLNGGTFTMNGGTVSDNNSYYGGGVYMYSGTFTMNGGIISDNRSSLGFGGGVYVDNGTFTMNGGTISDNISSYGTPSGNSGGGGVYVKNGTFDMSGGIITSNNADRGGGGVFVYQGTFIKTGNSIITGYASDTVNGNRSGDYGGNAVFAFSYVSGFSAKRIETTVGSGVDISYYFNSGSPIWWGDWE